LVKGFYELGKRIVFQEQTLQLLSGRLWEITNGLGALLAQHDTVISTRAEGCRKRHIRLSQKCLELAAKTQVLRNRGYAMDAAEEELKRKLMALEKGVFDPALSGRAEEIWARMVNIREKARQLQAELERAGKHPSQDPESAEKTPIDEQTMKRAKKVSYPFNSSKNPCETISRQCAGTQSGGADSQR
jgi:nuclear pore complex protein Nup54